jgi:hypothetical protein
MEKQKLFQYAIIWHPTKEEAKTQMKSLIVKDITTVLATDDRSLLILASREIPAMYLNQLDQIEIVIRSF